MSIAIADEGAVRRIWIDRTEHRNKLDPANSAALLKALDDANRDGQVRAVLLAAKGDVFCYGNDGEIAAQLCEFRAWMTKPVVAAVHGVAIGAGVGLLANAHVVVAAQGTSFALTEVRVGAWPAMFEAIAKAIGQRRAAELALTGRVFPAPEALQMGLVHEIAPAFEFEDRAEALALHLSGLDLTGRLPL